MNSFPKLWIERLFTSKFHHQTITQKMADQERSDLNVLFAMFLCALESLEMLITLLSELIQVSNPMLVLTEAI